MVIFTFCVGAGDLDSGPVLAQVLLHTEQPHQSKEVHTKIINRIWLIYVVCLCIVFGLFTLCVCVCEWVCTCHVAL